MIYGAVSYIREV